MIVLVLLYNLIVFLFGLYVLNRLKNYILHIRAIKKLPGPPRHAIFGNLSDLSCNNQELFKLVRVWGQKYKLYTILSYPLVSVNMVAPEDIELLISGVKHSSKNVMYDLIKGWLGDGLLISKGEKWQRRRKLLQPSFHFCNLLDFIKVFEKETNLLLTKLEEGTSNGQTINIVPYITEYTLYSMNETSMGVSLHCQQNKDEYVKGISQLGELVTYRIPRPWLYSNFFYYNFTHLGFYENKIIHNLHHFTNNIIFTKITQTQRNQTYSNRKRQALLDLLLNAMRNEGQIDFEGVQDEINTFMFEGHDTTSMALCFALMELSRHPQVQDRIFQEIDGVFDYEDDSITYQKLNRLHYLDRCVKECLRLYPSVPLISRLTDEDLVTSDKNIIPKGSIVNVHIYDLHRNPKIYPNPDHFDPDRFLQENVQKRHPFAYLPFSAGPRNCIGQKFALLEIKTALCGIIRNFVLEPVDTPDTITYIADVVLRPQNGIRVKLIKR